MAVCFLDTTRLGPDVVLSTLSCHAETLRTSLLSKKRMGRPADTTALAHCMSTSSLVLTILNGPSLDEQALMPKFSTTMESPSCPLSKDLLASSLPSCLACVSLSFSSFTTCEDRSRCSGYGLHWYTCFELSVSPRCSRQRIGLKK